MRLPSGLPPWTIVIPGVDPGIGRRSAEMAGSSPAMTICGELINVGRGHYGRASAYELAGATPTYLY
jgi:hypothetical protein